MNKRVIVIDGMGGGLGAQLVEGLRARVGKDVEILALGTNSSATERMLKAGSDRGASGENSIRVSAKSAALIMGPIGIVIPNGMLGEITPAIAEAVVSAPGERILVPVAQDHFTLVGFEPQPLTRLVSEAVELAARRLHTLD